MHQTLQSQPMPDQKTAKLKDVIATYVASLSESLSRVRAEDIERAVQALDAACQAGGFVYVLGNGGSAANASHFANELGKGVIRPARPRFRVVALTDNMPLFSAWANDDGYEMAFAEQLANLVQAGDVVIAISGSGNSANVLRAVELARQAGATTIAMTGFDGGRLKTLAQISIHVPSSNMRQVEDAHSVLMHLIGQLLMSR